MGLYTEHRNILKHYKSCTVQNIETYQNIANGALLRTPEHQNIPKHTKWCTVQNIGTYQMVHCSEDWNIPNGAVFRTL